MREEPKMIAIIEDMPELCPACEKALNPTGWEIDAEEVERFGKTRLIPVAIQQCENCGALVTEVL